jgi:hypothetical protein
MADRYFDEIKDFKVVSKLEIMNGELYEKFKNLVGFYGKILDSGAFNREINFTPHNFSNHCRDIYEILDIILTDEFWKKYPKGSNLFLLLCAVLLHDIIMAENMDAESRRNHSVTGKKYINDKIFEKDNIISNNIEMAFAQSLGDIILAHSDVKDGNENVVQYTFKEVVELYSNGDKDVSVKGESLNVPFLAALLRLSDELDISYKRVEGTGYEQKVITGDSRRHFEICEYFNMVQIHNERPYELSLEVFDEKFNNLTDSEKTSMAGEIINRYQKIKREFDVIYKEVLSNNVFVSEKLWVCKDIKLKNKKYYEELIKKKESLRVLK